MILSPFILVLCVSALAICGASAFKQFVTVRDPLWIVVGVIAYNLSNVGWIMLIDQTGLARATVIASAAQILILTLIGNFFGERVGPSGWIAAGLMCAAIGVSSFTPKTGGTDAVATTNPDSSSQSQTDPAEDQQGSDQGGH
ncbi:MAG: hypothetical protein AAF943_08760 [Pseudomonadota bacterium]